MENFRKLVQGSKTALVRDAWDRTIAAALFDDTGCVSAGEGGRGTLLRFAYAEGTGLIRHYQRGGLIRHFLKDAYLLQNRPLRELRLHAYVLEKGLPVPAPLGACWERRGLWFRGAFATQELDARNLLDYLLAEPESADATLQRCGALIRHMHDLGVFHADLQLRNVLVGKDRLYLIDFDKASLHPALSPLQRARNLFRLRRSIEKNRLPLAYFQPVCRGYGVEKLPEWVGRVYGAKGRASDLLSRR